MKKFYPIIIILTLLASFLPPFAPSAHAGLIIRLPSNLGISTGLVGYWTFDGNKISGTSAIDSAGANTGTITGASKAIGKIGQGMSFDGSDDYINVSDSNSLDVTKITMSAWVKSSTAGKYIIAKDPPPSSALEGQSSPAQLTHYSWGPSGRTFTTGIPGQFTYKSKIGQRNVKLADGAYAPYIWDEQNKILKFADSEIHLNGNEWGLWSNNQKIHEIAFTPEIKIDGEWQKEIAKVSNFRIKEIKTTGPTDYIELAYDLETDNQKSTITLKTNGSNDAKFAFDTEAKEAGEYRLAIEQDSTGLEPVYAEKDNNNQKILLGYKNPSTGFYWKWLENEAAHYVEEKKSSKLALLLNEDKYQAGEVKGVYPDTWGADIGIVNNADDGTGIDGSWNISGGWSDLLHLGDDGSSYNIGARWTGITIPSGSIIDTTYIDLYSLGEWYDGTAAGNIQAWDADNAGQFSGSTVPTSVTKTTASVPWTPGAPYTPAEWKTTPNINGVVQEILDSYGLDNDAINFTIVETVGSGNVIGFEDFNHAGANEPELTITYTSAAAKTDVPYGLNITSGGKAQIMFISSDVTYSATSTTSVNDNKWHHVLGTYDGANLRIYVDGVLEDTQAGSGNLPTNAGDVRIGADYQTTPANFFNGTLDDVRVYNRALSPSEIKRLYNMGGTLTINKSPVNSLTTGLIGYWTFDGNKISGANALDSSGQNNTGTITGATKTIGKLGQGMSFDGSDDYINVSDSNSLDVTNITMSAWVKSSTAGRYIMAKDPPPSSALEGQSSSAQLTHYNWGPSGRTFTTGIPGQFTYKSKIGQRNVKLADGAYAPYIWDEQNKILKFADSEIHLNGNEWEFWSNNQKVHEIAFTPEIKIDGEWRKEIAKVSNFRIKETKTDGPTDYIELAYDLETDNQKSTIALRVGGVNDAQFSFDTEAKQAGEYRLAIEQDSTGLELIYASNEKTQNTEHKTQSPTLLGYRNPQTGFYWRWQEDEAAHYIEEKHPLRLALLLNQDYYQAGETKGVYPDTWGTDVGIAASSDDGYETNDSTWDHTNIYIYMGEGGGAWQQNPGLRWDNITIAGGATINSTLIDMYKVFGEGVPVCNWQAWAHDDAPIFDSSNRPATVTKTTASVQWTVSAPGTPGWATTQDLSSITQEITDRGGWTSGNAINYLCIETVGNGNTAVFYSYDEGTEPELTITYTPAAAKTDVPYGLNITSGGKAQVMFISSDVTYSATSTTSVNDNKWHHVLGTYDGANLRIYVDGVLEDTQAGSGNLPTNAGDVRIGADYQTTPANFFNGTIDDVRIYNRALSASEIKRLYNMGGTLTINKSPVNSLTTGLIGYWTFDGNKISGANALDSSGQNNTGTITGATKTIGKLGQGLSFDGSDDAINLSNPSSLNNIAVKTISAWVKPGSISSGLIGNIFSSVNATFSAGWNFILCSNQADFCPSAANTYAYLNTFNSGASFGIWRMPANTAQASQWQHVAMVYNRGSSSNVPTFYFNGQQVAATAVSSPSGSADNDSTISKGIGALIDPGNIDVFPGPIDDVRVYNRALSAEEIQRLYNMGR